MKKTLRSGYTTGSCAAAAARGATLMIARQEPVEEVTIDLPAGVSAAFSLYGQSFSTNSAACFVIKDAGDDPDVTNGAEVWATATRHPLPGPSLEGDGAILITGGTGIGKVTKPGLAVAPGEWAINPVPRRMIEQAVGAALSEFNMRNSRLNITISIPDGAQRAKKTLNARLGIIGGLSILGTTGIVRPISAKAWTDTIDAALDVARACGCKTVVLSTGRTSEMAAQKFMQPAYLQEEAFIMMGDHAAHALVACRKRGFDHPFIACQFAKLLKIACGHENTHAGASELDLAALLGWARADRLSPDILEIVANANTAREIIIATSFGPALLNSVCARAHRAVQNHALGVSPAFLVADYAGHIVLQQ